MISNLIDQEDVDGLAFVTSQERTARYNLESAEKALENVKAIESTFHTKLSYQIKLAYHQDIVNALK